MTPTTINPSDPGLTQTPQNKLPRKENWGWVQPTSNRQGDRTYDSYDHQILMLRIVKYQLWMAESNSLNASPNWFEGQFVGTPYI